LHSGGAEHSGHRVTQVTPRYPCSRCHFSASSCDGLAVHVVQMHREEWICSECGADFDTKTQWQEHCRTYHSCHYSQTTDASHEKAIKEEGDIAANDGALCLSSLSVVKPENDDDSYGSAAGIPKYTRNYACPHKCGFGTRQSRDFLHHLRDHHGEKFAIFYCDRCSYASKFLAKVKRHQTLIHERVLPSSSRGEGHGQVSPDAISLRSSSPSSSSNVVHARDGAEARVPCSATESDVPGFSIDYDDDEDDYGEEEAARTEEGEDSYDSKLLIDESPLKLVAKG
ncbi:unnamed protein product, partial [Soboliphyme baturini]|uniref:C2H2-type domain-containing protein n=1 Tax=Soboliphyme baturini TaxID=241478 RepID=A0A183JBB8_9BILA